MTSIVVGFVLGVILVFAIARVMFGSAVAVALSAIVGGCFAGPPGVGCGIVLGIILVPVTGLLGALVTPDDEC